MAAPMVDAPVFTFIPSAVRQRLHIDVVSVLTVWLAFVFFVPSRYTFTPLGGAGRVDRLIGFGLLVWWLIQKVVPGLTQRERNPMRVFVLFNMMTWFASAAYAYERGLSPLEKSGIERASLSLFATAGIVLSLSDSGISRERFDTLMKRVTYFALFTSLVASLQFFAKIDITPYLKPPGLGLNYDLFGIETRSALNRVAGTGIHAIEYGATVALVFPIAVHYALHSSSRLERQLRWALAGYLGVAGLFSISRTNTIALATVCLAMFMVWNARQRFTGVICAAGGLVVVRALVPGLVGTIKQLFLGINNDPSIEGRTNDYEVAFAYIRERPWLGRGPGTFSLEEYIVLDNQWLGYLITRGWLGVITVALLFVVSILMARRVLNTARHDNTRHLAQVLAGALFMSILVLFFFDAFSFPQFGAMVSLLWGAATALWMIENRSDPLDTPRGQASVLKESKSVRTKAPKLPSGGSRVLVPTEPRPSRHR